MSTDRIVSVVIPCYNHEDYVEKALSSVVEQSYGPIELIVIDDQSKDSSFDRVKLITSSRNFRGRFVRCVVHQNERNLGAHGTINAGIAMSRGEFLTILNSDDFFESNRFSEIVKDAPISAYSLYFTLCNLVDASGRHVSISRRSPSIRDVFERPYHALDNFPTLGFAFLDRNIAISTGNLFFSRKLFDKVGLFRPFKYVHDWDFVLRSLFYCEPIFCDSTSYFYRLHSSNSFTSLADVGEQEVDKITVDFFTVSSSLNNSLNKLVPDPRQWKDLFQVLEPTTYLLKRARRLGVATW